MVEKNNDWDNKSLSGQGVSENLKNYKLHVIH